MWCRFRCAAAVTAQPGWTSARGWASPNRVRSDTIVASRASWDPCQRGRPFATTSMRRASPIGTSTLLPSAASALLRSQAGPQAGTCCSPKTCSWPYAAVCVFLCRSAQAAVVRPAGEHMWTPWMPTATMRWRVRAPICWHAGRTSMGASSQGSSRP